MKTVCACRMCRRAIRQSIEEAFIIEPRWMGEFTIRAVGMLSWVPLPLYRHILGRMCLLGIVIKSTDPADEFPRYLLARCMVPVRAAKGVPR
jgi:hypothetical protein